MTQVSTARMQEMLGAQAAEIVALRSRVDALQEALTQTQEATNPPDGEGTGSEDT